jgi:hypothetical protein
VFSTTPAAMTAESGALIQISNPFQERGSGGSSSTAWCRKAQSQGQQADHSSTALPMQAVRSEGTSPLFGMARERRLYRVVPGRDFTPPVPETFAMVDGRMVDGHADGRG